MNGRKREGVEENSSYETNPTIILVEALEVEYGPAVFLNWTEMSKALYICINESLDIGLP